jgi:DNA-binding NarL/FixJ family response regulator
VVNVFLIEDALQVRKRLRALLQTVPGVTVVGEADSVSGGINGVLGSDADTVLLDLQLTDGSGLTVLPALKAKRPTLHVIVLSNFASAQHRQASFAAGADVFLDKSHEFMRVPEILRGWLPDSGAGAAH